MPNMNALTRILLQRQLQQPRPPMMGAPGFMPQPPMGQPPVGMSGGVASGGDFKAGIGGAPAPPTLLPGEGGQVPPGVVTGAPGAGGDRMGAQPPMSDGSGANPGQQPGGDKMTPGWLPQPDAGAGFKAPDQGQSASQEQVAPMNGLNRRPMSYRMG